MMPAHSSTDSTTTTKLPLELNNDSFRPLPRPSLAPISLGNKKGAPRPPVTLTKDRECQELNKLLTLVNTPPSKQQLPSLDYEGASDIGALQWPVQQPTGGQHQHQSTEAVALEQFSLQYKDERCFSKHVHGRLFAQIFSALVKQRLSNLEWTQRAPPENILRVLMCLRILMRDPAYQKNFSELGAVSVLSEHLQKATDSYLTYGEGPYVVDILKEMTNIFQKLSAVVKQRDWLVSCGVHKALVLLLCANDVIVLHCTLHALISMAQSQEPMQLIAELNSIEILLRILQGYDTLSKVLAANLLRSLCADQQARLMVKHGDGIPLLLSLLHSESLKLLWNVVWCLVQLSEDQETSNDVRQMGGIPLLLALLGERKFVSERSVTSGLASATIRSPAVMEEEPWSWNASGLRGDSPASPALLTDKQSGEMRELQWNLKSACCACLTTLIHSDTNAQQIIHANGLYSLALLLLPQQQPRMADRHKKLVSNLQANAFRTLRFLFSLERNRRLFKRLFPPDLFGLFIDIGHYKHDIKAYRPLVEKVNSLDENSSDEMRENIEASNQNKAPSRCIGEYAVLELLGSGAFGTVYKVRRKTAGQSYLAMKEISTATPSWGKSNKERMQSVGMVMSELAIIREQLKHPNIVRYYKTFVENEKLYILMDLIEGAAIGEHFKSLKEKKEKFSEDRIWHIFIQIVLGLRYLHKDKGIVHRDLTPNNIMLGESDKVTITDFGLAKQKRKDCSKMTSVVGTILYSCPEIVQSKPYGEKADVWAAGCVLYEMCTLNPPFYSNNMLHLATKIVGADFKPISPDEYSEKVTSTVNLCITAEPEERPDIVGVAAHLADILLLHMDGIRKESIQLEKRFEREKRRTQENYSETNRHMQNYHQMFLVSQERYDKLVNLASSGGGASMKDDAEMSDSIFSDQEGSSCRVRTKAPSTGGAQGHGDEANENGWTTDEDLSSSGNESQCQSRESSAGLGGRGGAEACARICPRPPDSTPTSHRKQPRGSGGSCGGSGGSGCGGGGLIGSSDPLQQQLILEIPAAKSSRDSGISSGDPSPNNPSLPNAPGSLPADSSVDVRRVKSFSKSVSDNCLASPMVDSQCRKIIRVNRPNSATATLTISPQKVRQISDPILQMLHQLHKIIYICQLPPTLCPNPRRRVIERFKRALFAPQSTSFNLKNELRKLLTGSRELIDLIFGPTDSPKLAKQVSQEAEAMVANSDISGMGVYDTEAGGELGITYEQMQNIIESVLVESGYYDMSPHARHRTMPLGPIGVAPPDPFGIHAPLKSV